MSHCKPLCQENQYPCNWPFDAEKWFVHLDWSFLPYCLFLLFSLCSNVGTNLIWTVPILSLMSKTNDSIFCLTVQARIPSHHFFLSVMIKPCAIVKITHLVIDGWTEKSFQSHFSVCASLTSFLPFPPLFLLTASHHRCERRWWGRAWGEKLLCNKGLTKFDVFFLD